MAEVRVLQLDEVAMQLRERGAELTAFEGKMTFAKCFESDHFTQGLFAFSNRSPGLGQANHPQTDVVAYVISGTGRLRSGPNEFLLKQGSMCYVPAGEPHEFQAMGERELVLLYTLVEAGPKA